MSVVLILYNLHSGDNKPFLLEPLQAGLATDSQVTTNLEHGIILWRIQFTSQEQSVQFCCTQVKLFC